MQNNNPSVNMVIHWLIPRDKTGKHFFFFIYNRLRVWILMDPECFYDDQKKKHFIIIINTTYYHIIE